MPPRENLGVPPSRVKRAQFGEVDESFAFPLMNGTSGRRRVRVDSIDTGFIHIYTPLHDRKLGSTITVAHCNDD